MSNDPQAVALVLETDVDVSETPPPPLPLILISNCLVVELYKNVLPAPMKFKDEIPTILATVRPADTIPILKPRQAVTIPAKIACQFVPIVIPVHTSNLAGFIQASVKVAIPVIDNAVPTISLTSISGIPVNPVALPSNLVAVITPA